MVALGCGTRCFCTTRSCLKMKIQPFLILQNTNATHADGGEHSPRERAPRAAALGFPSSARSASAACPARLQDKDKDGWEGVGQQGQRCRRPRARVLVQARHLIPPGTASCTQATSPRRAASSFQRSCPPISVGRYSQAQLWGQAVYAGKPDGASPRAALRSLSAEPSLTVTVGPPQSALAERLHRPAELGARFSQLRPCQVGHTGRGAGRSPAAAHTAQCPRARPVLRERTPGRFGEVEPLARTGRTSRPPKGAAEAK